jgi:hypothetical protein
VLGALAKQFFCDPRHANTSALASQGLAFAFGVTGFLKDMRLNDRIRAVGVACTVR